MKITQVTMKLNLEKSTHNLNCINVKKTDDREEYLFEGRDPQMDGKVSIVREGRTTKVYTSVRVAQEAFRESDSLATGNPVIIGLEWDEQPESFNAQYQHRDWWSRPKMGKCFSGIPERTQSLCVKTGKGCLAFVPMTGELMKSYVQGGKDNELQIVLTAYTAGIAEISQCCLIFTEADSIYQTMEEVWKTAGKERNFPLVQDRSYPEILEYLGWCSWDAFYTDISEEKVRQKVREIQDKEIPVRWILLDDGWLSVRNDCLYSMKPEALKFPKGFSEMCREIKENSSIDWIGVWHAFAGYWGGIERDSELHVQMKDFLYETKNRKLIPHFDTDKGILFWKKWYEFLKKEGIDFVKVDGQSAIKNYYRNNEPVARAAQGAHKGFETAAVQYMGGNVINCMGMAAENMMNRTMTGVSRNSDDFVPDAEEGFKEHLLQNAYNALYHSQVYHCDWDMFWTKHKDARKHALLRAISGGPVYVSDKIGETNVQELLPLCYQDGRLLRMDRCALPTEDSVFRNPENPFNIALTNTVNGTGALAVFHLGDTEKKVTTTVSPKQIKGLSGDEFLVYDGVEKEVFRIHREEGFEVSIAPDGYAYYLFLPERSNITPIGLINKYMSAHAVMDLCEKENVTSITLREGGSFGFASEKEIKDIIVNGESMVPKIMKQKENSPLTLYTIEIEAGSSPVEVRISTC